MSGAALLVIDMQRVYAPGGAWATPGFDRAEANILRLCRRYPRRLFTRHLPFSDPPGTWKRSATFPLKSRPIPPSPAALCAPTCWRRITLRS